jgi:hypothetical protein
VESKHRIWEEDGGETVRGGGVAAGCVGKLAARRKRNRRSESRAGCAAPTRQLNKAANRTCGKLPTCNCNLVTLVTEKKKKKKNFKNSPANKILKKSHEGLY